MQTWVSSFGVTKSVSVRDLPNARQCGPILVPHQPTSRRGAPKKKYPGGVAPVASIRCAWTAVVLLTLHLIEVVVWALAYMMVLPDQPFESLEKAVYFSVVTFATLGYGDITLIDHEWRILSGIEALNGVLLVGWTTALLFAVFQRCWKGLTHGHSA